MNRSIVLVILAVVGCGSGSGAGADRTQPASLELVTPGTPIEMQGGQTREIQLLVIGATGEQVTFSAQLPPFAKLVGSLLTLSPGRADAGDHQLTVTATAGAQSTSAELHVIVSAPNTPPRWRPITTMLGNNDGVYSNRPCSPACGICPGDTCVLGSPVSLFATVCDADLDPVTVDVEVVSLGSQFAKTPTHSLTAPVGKLQSLYCSYLDPACACFQIQFPDLRFGASYEFAVRITDAQGAVASFPYASDGLVPSDGWVHLSNWRFKTAP